MGPPSPPRGYAAPDGWELVRTKRGGKDKGKGKGAAGAGSGSEAVRPFRHVPSRTVVRGVALCGAAPDGGVQMLVRRA